MKKLNSNRLENDQEIDTAELAIEISDFNKIRYEICKSLDSNKAGDVVMLNLKPHFSYDLWFIMATALSNTHLKKLVQDIVFSLRKRGVYSSYVPNDLDYSSGWVALDYGELVVHVFTEEQRKYYQLEDLWKNAIFENYP